MISTKTNAVQKKSRQLNYRVKFKGLGTDIVAVSLNSSMQAGVIVTIFLMPAMAFLLLSVPFPVVSATTGAGTSEDIPTGANDPTLPQSPTPNMSNTTSEDIPTGANDPTIPLPSS